MSTQTVLRFLMQTILQVTIPDPVMVLSVHDIIELQVFYDSDAGGATDVFLSATLPAGLVWDELPTLAAQDPRSKIGDSGDINNPDGDNRQILAYVSDMVGATSGTLIFETRALGGNNGAALNGVSFDINSTENTSAITSTSFDFTLSSAPRMDLVVHNFGTIGLRPNRTNTEDGMVAYAGVYVRGTDLTRTGADAVKGSGDITSNFTFQFDASLLSPNAEIYDWGVTTGGATIRDANDGVSRNREIYVDDSNGNTYTAWDIAGLPAGRAFETASVSHAKERSVPDSGDWTVQSLVGSQYTIAVNGVQSNGAHFPTLDRDGSPIIENNFYYAVGYMLFFIPVSDIGSFLSVRLELTNFDPDSGDGLLNNFGTGTEPISNNFRTFNINGQNQSWPQRLVYVIYNTSTSRLETKTATNAGDGTTAVGHQMNIHYDGGRNSGTLPVSGIKSIIKFDNTAQKIIPANVPDNNGSHLYSVARVKSGTNNGLILTYGTDYIVEYGTGASGGVAGTWPDWDDMNAGTGDDTETSTVWTQDPTDIASLGGVADPITGISNAITKLRVTYLRDLESGSYYRFNMSMETIGSSTVDPTLNTSGEIMAIMANETATFRPAGYWSGLNYRPETGLMGSGSRDDRGDRLTLVGSNVDITKNYVDIGSGNVFIAGTDIGFTLDGEVSVPGGGTAATATNVVVSEILPSGMRILNNTAAPTAGTNFTDGSGTTRSVQSIEFYDGSTWSTSFTSGVTGIRWNLGDVSSGTTLPQLTFDGNLPFSAAKDQEYTLTAEISADNDNTPVDFRNSEVTVIADKYSALTSDASVVSATVGEDQDLQFQVGITNLSGTGAISWVDMVIPMPANGDVLGSSFNGTIANIALDAPVANLEVYVTTADVATMDAADGITDGFVDPGAPTDGWYEVEGAGNWQYTLTDVNNSVAGAPTMGQITAIRLISNKAVDPFIGPSSSFSAQINITPSGNVGVPSDSYVLGVVSRTNPSAYTEPLASNPSTVTVVRPVLTMETKVMKDPFGLNVDPTVDNHWQINQALIAKNQVFFRVKLTNSGTVDFSNVSVSNFIPVNTTYSAGTATASTGSTGTFPANWTLSLNAGESATLGFAIDGSLIGFYEVAPTAVADDGGSYSSTASMTSTLEILSNADDDTVADEADVDADNDGIYNEVEDPCFAAFTPPSVSFSSTTNGTVVTQIYTDLEDFFTSSTGSVNPVRLDRSTNLLAFTVGVQPIAPEW